MPGSRAAVIKPKGILTVLLLLMMISDPVASDPPTGIFIEKAQLEHKGDRYSLSADLEYRFPEVALKALNEGIPLEFNIRLTLERKGFLGIPFTVFEDTRHIQLRYLPLGKSYQIADLGTGAIQSFTSLMDVLNTLRRIRGWEIQSPETAQRKDLSACLAFRFDIEALPLPLRIEAYASPNWRIRTGAYRWPFEP